MPEYMTHEDAGKALQLAIVVQVGGIWAPAIVHPFIMMAVIIVHE